MSDRLGARRYKKKGFSHNVKVVLRNINKRIRRHFSYYKPTVFKRLKTKKKIRVVLRPIALLLIIAIVVTVSHWYSLFSGAFITDKPVERQGEYTVDSDVPDDLQELSAAGELNEDEKDDDADIPEQIDKTSLKKVTGSNIPIYKKQQKNKDIINILLLGSDTRVPGQRSRTDTMMVASYNKNAHTLSLLSLLRDSFVPIEGHGYTKLCHANMYGGPGLLINTLNDCFDLDLQTYVIIDFNSFQEVIDKIGGVDVYITSKEAQKYDWNNWHEGVVHLNGEQALEHARERYIDSDFGRTERQRGIVSSVYEQIRQLSLSEQVKLIEYLMSKVSTNMDKSTFISLASDVLSSGIPSITNGSMPFNDTWSNARYQGMDVLKIDLEKNKIQVNKFIYGQ